MCKELEAAGLHAPEYYSNSFMLQAIVRNSSIVKPEIGHKKSEIGHKKPEIGSEKMSFDTIKSKIESCKYNEPTVNNILKIYNDIDNNQIFGASDVRKILGCSPSTASEIMAKLRELGVVREVEGRGKGKCRFAYEDE